MGGNRGVKAGRSGSGASKARKATPAPGASAPSRPLREDLVRALALEAYAAIRDEGRVADRTLDFLLRRERRLYAQERRAVAEAVYGMLRAEGRLDFLLERGLGRGVLETLGRPARQALYYEAWRVLERRVPPARALAEGGLSAALLPGLLACAQPGPFLAELAGDPVRRLAVEESLPAWMARLFVAELGDEGAFALARSMNERAPLTLRVNRLKTERDGLLRALRDEGVEAVSTRWSPDGVTVRSRQNLFQLRAFRDGLFEIQDEGSQLLAQLLDPHPGWTVVDACAGAGGKTLALAASMRNRGRLVALDTEPQRLEKLAPRARRAGVHNWEAHVVAPEGVPPELERRLAGTADAVLIDAPCSGLGVLRRNPDARFRLDEGSVARFACIQRDLLARYAALARPGGRIVYATCSVAREEDEDVVEAILAAHPELELVPPSETLGAELAERLGAERYLRLLPHRHGTDGFFAALLRRKAA